jgi:phosphate transport system substrate-binding protein
MRWTRNASDSIEGAAMGAYAPASSTAYRCRIAIRAVRWLFVTSICALMAACNSSVPYSAASLERADKAIRISGSAQDRALLEALRNGFRLKHADTGFEFSLHGPESTLAGVYTGSADIAWMARELREPMERMAFEWVLLDKPFAIEVAHAALDSDRYSTQIGVFVHHTNPLRQMNLRELEAIFGAEHLRGDRNIRRWGELGVDDEWAQRTINVYGPVIDSVQALHFRRVVLDDSRKWNADYQQSAEGAPVISALAKDPYGIAYAPLRDATPDVKLLALATQHDGPYVLPETESVRSRTWPLLRSIHVVTAHTKTKPMRSEVRDFIAFVLSTEGQEIIAKEGGYLPLSDESARVQRERLP